MKPTETTSPLLVECIIVHMKFSTTKYYICDEVLRQDNTYHPVYNSIKSKAKPFLTDDAVKEYISRIHPTYRREYFTEKVMLPATDVTPAVTSTQEKIA
jgi:hypothetical protein